MNTTKTLIIRRRQVTVALDSTRQPPFALTDLLCGGELRVFSMGKIIQITCCGHENTSTTQSNLTLFALCDDGRLWEMSGANGSWREVPLPIPAGAPIDQYGVIPGQL